MFIGVNGENMFKKPGSSSVANLSFPNFRLEDISNTGDINFMKDVHRFVHLLCHVPNNLTELFGIQKKC